TLSAGETENDVDAGLVNIENAIGDKVWLDMGAGGGTALDGVQNGTEPGVANVAVSLFANGVNGLAGDSDDILVGSTTTDAYGKYLFEHLPNGDYNVAFTLPANYSFTISSGTDDGNLLNSDANILSGKTGTINLSGNETELDVDAGIIFKTSVSPNSIGDYVWFDANQDGIQDASSVEPPMAGVTVTLFDATGNNVVAITKTDASGKYLFNNLPENTDYIIGFSPKPGTVFTTTNGTSVASSTNNSDADTSTTKTGLINTGVAGTFVTGIDAGLKDDLKASLGDLVWNDLNKDGKQDAGEPVVPNVTLKLKNAGADGAIGGGDDTDVDNPFIAGVQPYVVVSDALGNYLFSGLNPAKYYVEVSGLPVNYDVTGQDTAPGGVNNNSTDSDFNTGTLLSAVYNLSQGQNYPGIDLGIFNNSVTPLSSLGNRVWNDINADGLDNNAEVGVPNVTVSLVDASNVPVNNPATGKPYVVVTDANGNYSFVDLPAGTYKIVFTNLPKGTTFTKSNVGSNDNLDSDANLASGTTNPIVLPASTDFSNVDGGIRASIPAGKGSVGDLVWVDANNDGIQNTGEQGVSNVTVNLLLDTDNDGLISGTELTTPFETTITNSLGNYIFTNLDAGNYQVEFVSSSLPSGYAIQTAKNDQGADDAKDSDADPMSGLSPVFTLAQGEDNLTLDLGIFNVSATNSIGNKVWLDNGDGSGIASDGIQNGTEPGLPGVTVNLLDDNGNIVSSILTDETGQYLFGNLPNGTYSVEFVKPVGFTFTTADQGTDTNDSDVNPISATTPSVTLTGNTNVANTDAGFTTTKAALGNVVWYDADGDGVQGVNEAGIAGVTVTLYQADGVTVLASAITDANGKYLFANLEPGTYKVGFTTVPAALEFTQQTTPNNTNNQDNTNNDASPSTAITSTVVLSAGEIDLTVDGGLRPVLLGSVGDYVWYDNNLNGSRDANEPAVPGVFVTLKNSSGDVVGTAITDGDGKYLISEVPAGTGYTITFTNLPSGSTTTSATGSNPLTNSDIPAGSTTGVTASFEIVRGQKTNNLDAGLIQGSPLLVKLSSFNVKTKDNVSTQVEWSTSEEIGADRFEVQRSIDGVNFETIHNVSALNKSKSISKYNFVDTKPNNGINYYRLKMIDLDGSSSLSSIRLVEFKIKELAKIYPNPSKVDKVNLEITNQDLSNSKVAIIDMTGKLFEPKMSMTEKGLSLDLTGLNPGTYIVRVLNKGKINTLKFTKQ
nr:T9SS type A sorting domain-containing protein [Pseudarcicella sp.]